MLFRSNDTATTEIYTVSDTLSLHDALPISEIYTVSDTLSLHDALPISTDGRQFQVVLAGNPFPGIDPAVVARDLLPAMQSAKPRPALTFTYDKPSPPTRPDYRLVLVFDPANNLNSDPVCAGEPPRFRPGTPGRFYVYAIYCRNDQAMSQTTAWTDATGPTDLRIERLFRELFPVIFSEQQNRWAFNDPMFR